MADLGTSVALQGTYEQPRALDPTYGDDIVKILQRDEDKKAKEQEDFNKLVSPYSNIDTKELLPERIGDYTSSANEVLKLAMDKRRQGNKNVFYDPEVQEKITKLKEKKAKYSGEYQVAKEYVELFKNPEMASEYDQEAVDFISKAWQGNAKLDDKNMVTQEKLANSRTYAKWGNPETQVKFAMSVVPDKDKDVMTKVINPDNTTTEKRIKGSQIFENEDGTPNQEGIKMMKEANKKLLLSDSQIARRMMWETNKMIDKMAEEDLVLEDKIKGMTPQELYNMQIDMTAQRMLDMQIANNKTVNKEFDNRAPIKGKGMSINFTSGGGISKGAVSLDPLNKPSPTFIEAKYSPKIKKAEERIAELEAIEKPNKFQLDELKAQKGLLEGLKKGEGLEQGKHYKFSNKKSGDDAFITIYPNNQRKAFRLEDITPTKDGFEISGVERIKTDEGKNIDTSVFYPLTLDIYTDIINENPDAVDVFNEAGIKPNAEKQTKAAPKKEAAIPTITNKAEFDKLPKGSLYKKADGKTYKKG
jgi:hypothetical protein